MRKTTLIAASVVLWITSGPAFGFLTGVSYLRFADWNHATVSSTGQTFENIFGDIDVTVTLQGVFELPTAYAANWVNTGGLPTAGEHSLIFTFSEPIRPVVKTNTVDRNEQLMVYASGSKDYYPNHGALPTVTHGVGASGTGTMIRGNGFGLHPETGSSSGEIVLNTLTTELTVTHQALTNNKYERVMVGIMVPEPNTLLLIGIGLMGLIQPLRRRLR